MNKSRMINKNKSIGDSGGGVALHCPNSACNYQWRYFGRFYMYATCPSCRRNVKIQENKVDSLPSVQVRGRRQIAAIRTSGDDALL